MLYNEVALPIKRTLQGADDRARTTTVGRDCVCGGERRAARQHDSPNITLSARPGKVDRCCGLLAADRAMRRDHQLEIEIGVGVGPGDDEVAAIGHNSKVGYRVL